MELYLVQRQLRQTVSKWHAYAERIWPSSAVVDICERMSQLMWTHVNSESYLIHLIHIRQHSN